MENTIEFDQEFKNFDDDISHIDDRLDGINANIVLLQTHIDRLTQLILNANNQDRNKYYSAQSNILKTLALYNDNYQRLLELKYKYRTEQGEYKLKTRKFIEIELKRIDQSEDSISHTQLIQSLSKLANSTNTQQAEPGLNFQFDSDEEI